MSERAQSENKVIVWAAGEQCDKPKKLTILIMSVMIKKSTI